jgi:hypothetical protein
MENHSPAYLRILIQRIPGAARLASSVGPRYSAMLLDEKNQCWAGAQFRSYAAAERWAVKQADQWRDK